MAKYVFCYPSAFRIRKKADAETFFYISNGTFYWTDENEDFVMKVFDKTAKKAELLRRPVFARGDIFFPQLVDDKPLETIWEQRKYINARLRGDY